MITQAPRGVEDWYGERMHKRAYVEKLARELARTYHMTEIITPMFEHTVLFQRGVGETTDVVQKEMYTFQDKGDRSITLRPEGTAGAARAYIEHGLHNEAQPAIIVMDDNNGKHFRHGFCAGQPQHVGQLHNAKDLATQGHGLAALDIGQPGGLDLGGF